MSYADQNRFEDELTVLYFKFSNEILQHHVTQAELSFWIRGTQSSQEHSSAAQVEDDPVIITLRQIVSESRFGTNLTMKYQRPVGKPGAWVNIDLTTMTHEWFKRPRDNLGVVVESAGPMEINSGTRNEPHMVIQTEKLPVKRNSRSKRAVSSSPDEASHEDECRRHTYAVDFTKFGWDWVIGPRKLVPVFLTQINVF